MTGSRGAPPPSVLADFPPRELTPDVPLFRMHRQDRYPWWFCNDMEHRFDLWSPQGTCHAALDPLGCFIERFGGLKFVGQVDVDEQLLAVLRTRVVIRLADFTDRHAAAFGVTLGIDATAEYGLPQSWAANLQLAGFEGVMYWLSHDTSAQLAGVAIFGKAGELRKGPWNFSVASQAIPVHVVNEAERDFGIVVRPVPS